MMMAARKKAAKKATKKKSTQKKPGKTIKKAAKKKAVKRNGRKPGMKKTAKTTNRKPTRAKSKTVSKPPSKSVADRPSFVGQPAPAFTLPTGDGHTISLADFRGKRVLLYFYPKDDTPGCTAQACALRDNMSSLAKANTVVIGVSKDDVASHRRFKDKYQLNFMLASDKDTGVAEKYGVWVEKNMYGRKYMGIERSTFLIDENGIVRNEWRKVSVPDHAKNVQEALAAL
jgi:peroxiredoxin Q/BCP